MNFKSNTNMCYNSNLPADCQGNNSSFPWNQTELEGEAKSLGSDCCEGGVIEEDGVLRCTTCSQPCEEVFESEEELQERLEREEDSRAEDAAVSRWEDRRNEY